MPITRRYDVGLGHTKYTKYFICFCFKDISDQRLCIFSLEINQINGPLPGPLPTTAFATTFMKYFMSKMTFEIFAQNRQSKSRFSKYQNSQWPKTY